jgi:putative restriction endonuclease
MDFDLKIRMLAFAWLADRTQIYGDVLPRTVLEEGFYFDEHRIPLVSPQGIFKPKILDLPLSMTTVPNSPYADVFQEHVSYKYRGTDAGHPDNAGLRRVMEIGRPLIYFFGITPGQYLAT